MDLTPIADAEAVNNADGNSSVDAIAASAVAVGLLGLSVGAACLKYKRTAVGRSGQDGKKGLHSSRDVEKSQPPNGSSSPSVNESSRFRQLYISPGHDSGVFRQKGAGRDGGAADATGDTELEGLSGGDSGPKKEMGLHLVRLRIITNFCNKKFNQVVLRMRAAATSLASICNPMSTPLPPSSLQMYLWSRRVPRPLLLHMRETWRPLAIKP